MKTCVYCGKQKSADEFSDEHIWPAALGGDFLDWFWRTEDVCALCNSASGVFVDGAFIKSFFVSGERAFDALDYLDPDNPSRALPLAYLGTIANVPTQAGEVADFWVVAPGANVVHFRAENEDDLWDAYAGGDPRRQSKRSKAGRVVTALTSAEPFWYLTALSSVAHHFDKAEKFVTNLAGPPEPFRELHPTDSQHAADLAFFQAMESLRDKGEHLQNQVIIPLAADGRFLAKLALAAGYKLFGERFLDTADARILRQGFREADPAKRRQLPILGSGYLRAIDLGGIEEKIRWPGGWVLSLMKLPVGLSLVVQSPSGRPMAIRITEDVTLLADLEPQYIDGIAWVTVPPAGRAVGPIPYLDYLAHQFGVTQRPDLKALAALGGRRERLPPTGIAEAEDSADSGGAV